LKIADGVIEGPDLELAAAGSDVHCGGLRAGNRSSFKFVWISSISLWVSARRNFAGRGEGIAHEEGARLPVNWRECAQSTREGP
jgi:hypothetical protein